MTRNVCIGFTYCCRAAAVIGMFMIPAADWPIWSLALFAAVYLIADSAYRASR